MPQKSLELMCRRKAEFNEKTIQMLERVGKRFLVEAKKRNRREITRMKKNSDKYFNVKTLRP